MSDEQIVARLDTIIAILQLAHREPIEKARQEIVADPVAAELLAASADWIESGTLQDRVAGATHQSRRTVQRRIAALLTQGFLEQVGSGPTVRYRNTNLI